MRGYTTLARIDGSAIHVARATVAMNSRARELPAELVSPRTQTPARSITARFSELAGIVREQWAITTFYLFDPESWR